MRPNIRHSANLELNQIFDQCAFTQPSSFNDFGNFIYKDHVTRIKYNVEHLKVKKPATLHADETVQSFIKTHKQSKSMVSVGKRKPTRFQSGHFDEIDIKKKELLHFLEHLQMMNKIRKNRNHVVSGIQRVQKRKSLFPTLNQSIMTSKHKSPDIDTLKLQIRKQVNDLSTQLFRQYMQNSQPYRQVFNQLSIASSKGALNTSKIRQIKQKIQECTKIKQDKMKGVNNNNIIRRRQLDTKENQRFEKYFSNVAREIDQEIHFKINHEASFNWKYGRKSEEDSVHIIVNYDEVKGNR